MGGVVEILRKNTLERDELLIERALQIRVTDTAEYGRRRTLPCGCEQLAFWGRHRRCVLVECEVGAQ